MLSGRTCSASEVVNAHSAEVSVGTAAVFGFASTCSGSASVLQIFMNAQNAVLASIPTRPQIGTSCSASGNPIARIRETASQLRGFGELTISAVGWKLLRYCG